VQSGEEHGQWILESVVVPCRVWTTLRVTRRCRRRRRRRRVSASSVAVKCFAAFKIPSIMDLHTPARFSYQVLLG